MNFFAHPLRKFAWTFELPNCWKVTLTSPVISPLLAAALAPGVVLLPLLPPAANPAAPPRGLGPGGGVASALATGGQADGGSQSCGGQNELTSAHGSPHLSASLELAAKDCCPTETGLTVNRRGESNARFRW